MNAPEARNFIKKETLVQVFSCEFREIPKNTFFYRTLLVAASVSCEMIDIFTYVQIQDYVTGISCGLSRHVSSINQH